MPHPQPAARAAGRSLAPVLTALVAALAVVLGGCSTTPTIPSGPASATSASASPSPTADTFPRDVTIGTGSTAQTVHLDARPTKIVVLGPALTETVYGVGAGPQVKAVDKLSDYPAEVAKSDLDAFQPSAEAVAAEDPDLVITTNPDKTFVSGLAKLKIPTAVLLAPSDLDGAYEQFRQVGELTGNTAAAEELVTTTRGAVDKAVASVTVAQGTSYYWELDPTYYSITSATFVGSVMKQFGLTNIADKSPKAAGGYPQLNAEFIIDADPDVIFLADAGCCSQSAATVKKRAGWGVIRAVKDSDGVVAVDDSLASRWGPRIADLATAVAASLTKLS